MRWADLHPSRPEIEDKPLRLQTIEAKQSLCTQMLPQKYWCLDVTDRCRTEGEMRNSDGIYLRRAGHAHHLHWRIRYQSQPVSQLARHDRALGAGVHHEDIGALIV